MKRFLDTSAQSIRIFYSTGKKKEVNDLLIDCDEVGISRYSWLEFHYIWLYHLIKIWAIAKRSDSLSDVLQELSTTFEGKPNVLQVIDALGLCGKDSPTTEMIADRAFNLLAFGVRNRYLKFPGKGEIQEFDHLDCTLLKSFSSPPLAELVNGVPVVRLYRPKGCSQKFAQCKISPFVQTYSTYLRASLDAFKGGKRDRPFQKSGEEVFNSPSKSKGQKCGRISDWTMIMHAPREFEVITSDEDWAIICMALGRSCIKLPIKPNYDYNQIKKLLCVDTE